MQVKIFNDSTGLIWCVTYAGADNGDTVSFFDCRHEFTEYGQFVSAYYKKTLLECGRGEGINLQGGVASWRMGSACLDRVKDWLETLS